MKIKYALVLTFFILSGYFYSSATVTIAPSIILKTSAGSTVKVIKGKIYFNNKAIYTFKYDDVIYQHEANKIIESNGETLLFVAINGNPSLNRLNVFNIKPNKASLVADAILSPIKDYDGDKYLEFGGSDITEAYPHPDSMYYVPFEYYEIRNGKVLRDDKLSRKSAISTNGIYIAKPFDKDGYCCQVIPKPIIAKK